MAKQRDVYLALAFGVVLALFLTGGLSGVLGSVGAGPSGDSSGEKVAHNCGDDGLCDLTITVQNGLNDTGQETFDTAMVIKGNGISTEISDTTDNTVSLQAGVEDVAFAIKGDSNDNSWIHSATAGEVRDGVLYVTTDSNKDITIYGEQHASLEARSYNNVDANFFNDSSTGGADPTSYQTDPITFKTNSDAKIPVGSGGQLDARIDVRTTNDDEEFADQGLVIGVVADTTKWDDPTVSWEGQALVSDSASSVLGDNGATAIGSTYDYFYKVDGRGQFNDHANPDNYKRTLDFSISALTGTNPGDSDDVQVDLIPLSKYEAPTADNELTVDSHDAGLNAIQSIFDITYDVT